MRECYRCDRYFKTNYKFDKMNWVCLDCSRDIMRIQGYEFNETDEQRIARYQRKAYWEEKKRNEVQTH